MSKRGEPRSTHGMYHTREYKTWNGLFQRCFNPRNTRYAQYGGRGITVCDRWNPKTGGSFENFYADMGPRPEDMSLDRIDNDGNYEPGNCRWATAEEQRASRRHCSTCQCRKAAA